MLGLLEHLLHHPGALHRIGVSGIVFHLGCDHQLPALLHARDQHRLEHCTGGIDRGRVAGGAGADDENGNMASGHRTIL